MRELLIGQMAELNCVSEKTLRVYHEQGLLVPVRIDRQTGYRYYSLDQCATLDAIQQLKAIGLSLAQVKEVLDRRDVDFLARQMSEQVHALDGEIGRLSIARQIAANLLADCDTVQHKPACDHIALEALAERRIQRFPINGFGVDDPVEAGAGVYEAWELDLRLVKHAMLERGYPLSLFRRVGCVISREDLLRGRLYFGEAFIFVDRTCGEVFETAETVPAGDFVTMYCDRMLDDAGRYKETLGLIALLDHIRSEGYRIRGDYLGEIIAESPAFLYEGRDMMFKLQIPVEVHHTNPLR